MRRPLLTLTTDFGPHGGYVAEMKGVVLGMVPDATIVDVCHTIAPHAVAEGAFVLERLPGAFPNGTVHLAVVDPGVGTDRRLVAAEAAGQWWLGPDNGLFARVLRAHPPSRAFAITNAALRRHEVSSTFHGRDILAPAAAHLLWGDRPHLLGPEVDPGGLVPLGDLDPVATPDGLAGRVQCVDAFGNLLTNVPAAALAGGGWTVEAGGQALGGLVRTYGERPAGTAVALVGSGGYLEVAVVQGSAARSLGLGVGSVVSCRREVSP
jgi:S-adenosylmethionine hydrolase